MIALALFMIASLEECRARSDEFATADAIAACEAASQSEALTKQERIEALQLLGNALVLAKEHERAEGAFARMLALDESALPTSDAGPLVMLAYERARSKLPAKVAPPKVEPKVEPPPPKPVPAALPIAPAGYGIAALGAVILVGGATVSSVAVYDLYFNRVRCSQGECYPEELAIGVLTPAYNGDGREKFVQDAGAIIGISTTVAVAGAALGLVGVLVAMSED